MLKTIQNLLVHNATKIAILTTISIAFLSLKTIHIENPLEISFLDKILHFIAYSFLTLTWLFSQRKNNTKIIIVFSLFFYGIMLEFFQAWFTINRTKDILDVVANTCGIIFALLSYNYMYKYYLRKFVNLK